MPERIELSKITGSSLKSTDINLDKEPFIVSTEIDGVYIIQRPYFSDNRGGFQEDFRIPDLEERFGSPIKILQVQASDSLPHVLRGIHVEDQQKIITPRSGHLLACFVDLRPDSETFKKVLQIEFEVKEGERRMTLFLPSGVGNSFYVYPDSGKVQYSYCVTSTYSPENAAKNAGRAVKWNDEKLAIRWPTDGELIISNKDKNEKSFDSFIDTYMKGLSE